MDKQPQHRTALITGASGGIGLALAQVFARHGHDLVLIARSEDKLKALAADLEKQHGIRTRVLARDLTDPAAPDAIFEQLQTEGVAVEILVNNAGYASYGCFHELELQRELNMIQLNVTTLVHLSHRFLQPMLARRRGRILNVASTAAFQPGPLMATYYATKSFVLSFSEAIANELQGQGVTVTALCPGPTASGFQARANMEDSRLVQDGLMDAATVAEAGYAGLMAGKTVVVPGTMNYLLTLAPRFAPRNVTTRIVRSMQERTGSR